METRYINGRKHCLSEAYQSQLVYTDCEIVEATINSPDVFLGLFFSGLILGVAYLCTEQKTRLDRAIEQAERSLRC
jgi:hypothetical protein